MSSLPLVPVLASVELSRTRGSADLRLFMTEKSLAVLQKGPIRCQDKRKKYLSNGGQAHRIRGQTQRGYEI
jgi:hypothetical protein